MNLSEMTNWLYTAIDQIEQGDLPDAEESIHRVIEMLDEVKTTEITRYANIREAIRESDDIIDLSNLDFYRQL